MTVVENFLVGDFKRSSSIPFKGMGEAVTGKQNYHVNFKTQPWI